MICFDTYFRDLIYAEIVKVLFEYGVNLAFEPLELLHDFLASLIQGILFDLLDPYHVLSQHI